MKRELLAALSAIIAIVAALLIGDALATRIKPNEKTLNTMFLIHRRILMYAAQCGHPPKTLEELPDLQGYNCELVDAWKRKVDYQVIDGNIVELTSTTALVRAPPAARQVGQFDV
jgi:hypothetical protein